MKTAPLISVVVPVYGTEQYLKRCLDSILNQTYKNIEIIIVNDDSKDNSESIILEYVKNNTNIKYVRHAKNRGLFRARISGVEEAEGDYIAFVDSDDYLSCDYYRLLVRKALETDADMVIGNFLYEYEDGSRRNCNLDSARLKDFYLTGDNVLNTFMEQKGLCYSWQLVWNKIYKKSIWDSGYEEFVDFSDHHPKLIMTEDIAFSCWFWTHAKKAVNTRNAYYYYYQRSNRSTDAGSSSKKKFESNLNDTIAVFNFFKYVLQKTGNYEKYEKEYIEWRKFYGRTNVDRLSKNGLLEQYAHLLKHGFFGDDELRGEDIEDWFTYSTLTPVTDSFRWFQDIKEAIKSEECEIVSFDIFDTLILRPFWYPTDLFYLMNKYFMDVTGATSDIDFAQMRIESEKSCRERIKIDNPAFDDITLDEIYEELHRRYYLSEDVCSKLKAKEAEYELRFCTVRKTGKELYEEAVDCGKTVIFTSDMYLTEDIVRAILRKNGYGDHRLFLSSEVRQGKWSGRLYKYLLKQCGVKDPDKVIHIGDNWGSDVEMPHNHGIRSFHLCKPVDMMQDLNPSIYSGEGFTQAFINNATGRDMNNAIWGFWGLRTMLALTANKIFDNPYISFDKNSDFNADPVFVGYYVLGMHLYAVVKWLIDEIKDKNVNRVQFVARDGWLVKRAYDMLNKDNTLPKSNYLYLSRKALALADVNQPVDFYSLITKINIFNSSPRKLLDFFDGMIDKDEAESFLSSAESHGFFRNEKFTSRANYEQFIKLLLEQLWEKFNFKSYRKMLHDYFTDLIDENDILFDIGYSGRTECALKNILGYAPESYYIHTNSEMLDRRMHQANFKNHQFYHYKPNITGVMREHMFMKLDASTIGYRKTDKGVEPIFEEYKIDYHTRNITELVQDSAMEFVSDMVNIFGDELELLYFRREDASQPLEYYLQYGKQIDRNIFATLIFEDDLGEGKKLRAVDFWSGEIKRNFSMSKNISPENRVIEKEQYIGMNSAKVYVPKKSAPKPSDKTECVMFCDKITNGDDIDTKFSKVADNTDNLMTWSALEDTLDPTVIKNWYMTHPGGFDESKYDVYLSTHLNWIQENADITWLNNVLERIGDKPLLPISIGFSKENETENFKLSSESIKTLSAIAERCASVGVKGEYSAEVLAGFGIKNSVIIGCPSLYIDIRKLKNISAAESSLKKFNGSFKPFWGKFSDSEKKLLEFFCDNKFSLTASTRMELTKDNIEEDKLLEKLTKYVQDRQIYFDAGDWHDSFNDTDFVMGMDFYNNAAALQAGVPALFITYETIGRELCKFFKLPCVDINKFDSGKKINDYYQMADYSSFKKTIDDNYRTFVDFLRENGLDIHDSKSRIIKK